MKIFVHMNVPSSLELYVMWTMEEKTNNLVEK